MSAINFHTKEISVKIVYYGPGLCGKTTSLQAIYDSLPERGRPKLVSLATEVDRTIFFDFLPVTAYRIRDFRVRLQLYTVPGQVFYNATRKLVLNGVDGLIFVADSQRAMKDSNLESLQNLKENLTELGLEIDQVPTVLQYNKRDLTDVLTIEDMDQLYNPRGIPSFPTVATDGKGVFDALRKLSKAVVTELARSELGRQLRGETDKQPQDPETSDTIPRAKMHPDSMGEAVSRAAQQHAPALQSFLWPNEEVREFGQAVERALADERWGDAVVATHKLLLATSSRWASMQSSDYPEPLPAYLFFKGVSPARFRTLLNAARAARAGSPVEKGDAMSVLVLALEALW